MSDYKGVTPESATIATLTRHIMLVRSNLTLVRQELQRRAAVHDFSKWSTDELPGFVKINATAREFAFGSQEYRDSISKEQPTLDLHFSRNSHHAEFHSPTSSMGWLDIIEMVCDMKSANVTYGTTPWDKAMEYHLSRHDWSDEQVWLMKQVADFLGEN